MKNKGSSLIMVIIILFILSVTILIITSYSINNNKFTEIKINKEVIIKKRLERINKKNDFNIF